MKKLLALLLVLLPLQAFAAGKKTKTVQVYAPDVLERYNSCRERTDLDGIKGLLEQHRVKRIDATIYGLPKDDFDDQTLLTIEERLFVRAEKEAAGNRLPTSGPLQYPHHLREALDHNYVAKGQRPDCNAILLEAGKSTYAVTVRADEASAITGFGVPEVDVVGSGWAGDKDINGDSASRGETNIVVDFANQNRIVASSCPSGSGETSNHIARSTDWGATFTSGSDGNNSGTTWECDPVSYYKSASGALFHSKIGCNTGTCAQTYVMMRRSTDNGATFTDCGRPTTATNSDRQWHVVDNTPTSPGYGNIYMTWHDGNQEKVAVSTNAQNCATWNAVQNLTPAAYQAITPDINVGRDGRVYVVWGNYGDSTFKIRGSSDQGATWTAPSSGTTGLTLKAYNANWSNSVPSQCQRKVASQPLVDVNRCDPAVGSCSQTHPGRVYVAMLDFNASCSTAGNRSCATWDANWNDSCHYTIWLTTSDNNGTTWTTPVDLFGGAFAGLADGNNVDHILGYMRVDEKSGDLFISYSRSKLAPASAADRQQTDEYIIRSTDGGATWGAPFKVSSMWGNERASGSSSFERGDYASLAVYNGVAWPVWIDRRSGTTAEHIVTRKICTEPTHWSERGTSPAAPPTNATATGVGGQVTVTWAIPDLFWGDGDESPSSRKFQLWVDGILRTDDIPGTSTSTTYTGSDCLSHSYVIRAVNQCGLSKDYAAVARAATGCCVNNPSVVDVTPNGPVSVCLGTGVTLTATQTGGVSPTYQWTRDGSPISGAIANTYLANDTGTHAYNCVVTGSACSGGTTDSVGVSITWVAAPTFAGLTSATLASAGSCGVVLAWSAGTPACGGALTYNVYRSTSAGFTPAVENLIALGLSGTGYTDSSGLAAGTTYYYVVRAQDSVLGVEDANLVTASATPLFAVGTFTETFEGTGFDNSGWTHQAVSGATDWAWSTARSQTPTHSWFAADTASTSDRILVSPAFPLSATSTLSFWHTYAFEGTTATCYDGGTLEISTDGGTTWSVVPDASFTAGGFTGTANGSYSNPIGGKRAWCAGTVGTMTQVTVNLAAWAGKSAKLRWHAGDDSSTAATGWYVDSVTVSGVPVDGAGASTITAPAAVCAGSAGNTASVPDAGGSATYAWTITNGTITSSATTRTITFTAGPTGPLGLGVSVHAGYCPAVGSRNVTLTSAPSATVTTSTAVCAGSTGNTASVPDAGAGATYLWTIDAGATITSGQGTRQIVFTAGATGPIHPAVTVTAGCASNGGATVAVNTIPAKPSITPGGATTFCAGGSVTLTASAGSSYLWSTGATTPSITVSTAGSYTVRVFDAIGCASPLSDATTVTVNAIPAKPTITPGGATTFCAGGSVTLTSSAGTSYLWSTGATTPSITVSTSGSYTVQVTDANSCPSPLSDATVVTVNPAPAAPVITTPGTAAAGSTGHTASVPDHAGSTYSWSITNGTITSGAGTASIVYTAGVAGPLTLTVTETEGTNGCTSAEGTTTVTVTPVSTGLGFFPLTPCRIIDTRNTDGPLGGPALLPGVSVRTFAVAGTCGIPITAKAVAVNLTVTQAGATGFIRVYPGDLTGGAIPITSSLHFQAAKTRANNSILKLAADGTGTIGVENDALGATVHFILDVVGYFE